MTELRQRQPREKRERPPMPPLWVRVEVAERQYAKLFPWGIGLETTYGGYIKPCFGLGARLMWLLNKIFEDGENVVPHALDHSPALILRFYNPRIKDVASRYKPHAHDPDHLVYMAKPDHQQKTSGRRPGAERTVTTKGSDAHLAAKFRRLEGQNKPKRKAKIAFRKKPWPKRKMRQQLRDRP
jgi:hypothetical protein